MDIPLSVAKGGLIMSAMGIGLILFIILFFVLGVGMYFFVQGSGKRYIIAGKSLPFFLIGSMLLYVCIRTGPVPADYGSFFCQAAEPDEHADVAGFLFPKI
jgi:hypothetical protein